MTFLSTRGPAKWEDLFVNYARFWSFWLLKGQFFILGSFALKFRDECKVFSPSFSDFWESAKLKDRLCIFSHFLTHVNFNYCSLEFPFRFFIGASFISKIPLLSNEKENVHFVFKCFSQSNCTIEFQLNFGRPYLHYPCHSIPSKYITLLFSTSLGILPILDVFPLINWEYKVPFIPKYDLWTLFHLSVIRSLF